MAALAGRLPEHMLPTRIVVIDEFPVTPQGKVDREQLLGRALRRPLPPDLENIDKSPRLSIGPGPTPLGFSLNAKF